MSAAQSVIYPDPSTISRPPEAGSSASGDLLSHMAAALTPLRRWWAHRAAERALEDLDARMLRDLGIDRSEIARVVRRGRDDLPAYDAMDVR